MNFQTPNSIFKLAADCINYSNRNIFLTGKAGTGKTTFLKHIRETTLKQNATLAPTGVAAINAGGVTIHSFFQLPFTPFIPEGGGFTMQGDTPNNSHTLTGSMRLNRERIQLLQQLELLIIDEISMVRCDVLDAIDTVLRHFRNNYHQPFGGVQLLVIGDMYQLPPVAADETWQILSNFYRSPYFFDSQVMQQFPPLYIELEKIYRQSDARFINLLNAVRNNAMDDDLYRLLHSRYLPQFQPDDSEHYITLATHNYKAEQINVSKLQQLKGSVVEFKAVIEGEFSEKAYPADELLRLKTGAQVMFIKNDLEKERRYFNGKIGEIKSIGNEKIMVQCGSEETIEVKKETWKNIRYTFNETSQKVEEEELGSFTQYPLRLAWAITIHKSQGLTFERAVIDAGAAFAPGQVYVALSRCTSLEGLVLQSRITPKSLFSDERINAFAAKKTNEHELPLQLMQAKHQFQQTLLKDLFSFAQLSKNCNRLISSTETHASAFNTETMLWLSSIEYLIEKLDIVAQKFQAQLERLLPQEQLPEENNFLQQRLKAAVLYFENELQLLLQHLTQSPAITDSRQYALAYNEDLKTLYTMPALKLHLLKACTQGFNAETYMRQKNKFTLPEFNVNAYSKAAVNPFKDNPHPVLLKALRKLRDELCDKDNLPIYIIAGSTTLDEMARYLPQTPQDLLQISGFGKAKVEKFGQQFLDIINAYCSEHSLIASVSEKEPKRKRKEKSSPKPDTKAASFELYTTGKTIAEIASIRNLATQTIEGHLAHFIQLGKLDIHDFIGPEKIARIVPALNLFDGGLLTTVKEKLDNDISFGEIRMVLAWHTFQQSKIIQPE